MVVSPRSNTISTMSERRANTGWNLASPDAATAPLISVMVGQTIGLCHLLQRACGPRNFMNKWGSLDVAGRAGQHRKPAEAGCGQNWPPHLARRFFAPPRYNKLS